MAAMDRGEYGATDVRETFDDAVSMALLDQERAGIDIISDGELRRFYFVQSFYGRMTGIAEDPPLRKVGVYGYDSPVRYHTTGKVDVPDGLGIVEEYQFARERTTLPLKVTCPGPLTLTIHIRPREGYRDRLELAQEFAGVINRELRQLEELGADFIQLDEPSFAIIPGTTRDWVELYNACVEGVNAKLALHVCFGNLGEPAARQAPLRLDAAGASGLPRRPVRVRVRKPRDGRDRLVERVRYRQGAGSGRRGHQVVLRRDARGRGRAHPRAAPPRQPGEAVPPTRTAASSSSPGGFRTSSWRRSPRARR